MEVKKFSVKVKEESGQTRVVNKGDIKLYKPVGEVMRENAQPVDIHNMAHQEEGVPSSEDGVSE